MVFAQPTVEFVIVLLLGTIISIFGIFLLANPLLLWPIDKKWLGKLSKRKQKTPSHIYGARQSMGAVILIGFGITLLTAAFFLALVHNP
jgi:hypothetical protein